MFSLCYSRSFGYFGALRKSFMLNLIDSYMAEARGMDTNDVMRL